MLCRHNYTKGASHSQWSFVSFLLLQLSNSFLRIVAVPNKAVFCNSPILIVTPSFSSHASNLLLTTPSDPSDLTFFVFHYPFRLMFVPLLLLLLLLLQHTAFGVLAMRQLSFVKADQVSNWGNTELLTLLTHFNRL